MAARGFYDLMRRRAPQYFYAFDLLWKDSRDLRGLPLIKRKRLLKKVVKSPVLFVEHLAGRGVDLFESVCQRDLEGIVRQGGAGAVPAGENNLGEDQEP
jgi:ATP-dependent DNA ligase